MESNGIRNRIQVSQATADLIKAGGMSEWITPREDLINAKGKGKLQTYWVEPKILSGGTKSIAPSEQASIAYQTLGGVKLDEKIIRLIEWNVDVLASHLRRIIDERKRCEQHQQANSSFYKQKNKKNPSKRNVTVDMESIGRQEHMNSGQMFVDEVAEIIEMTPSTDQNLMHHHQPMHEEEREDLDSELYSQIREYVTTIANMYREVNPFHNFDHASHVAMSVAKLMGRITSIDGVQHQVLHESHDEDMTEFSTPDDFYSTSELKSRFDPLFVPLLH